MNTKRRLLSYTFFGTIDQFKARLISKASQFEAETKSKDALYTFIRNHRLEIGLERVGHSSGYWYIADINETNITVYITGTIELIGGAKGTDGNHRRETILLIFLGILLAPLTILYLFAFILRKISFPAKRNKREERLETFMTKYMGCISGNVRPAMKSKELPVIPSSEAIKTLRYAGLAKNLRYLAYSKDGARRLEIFANDVGSCSYRYSRVSLFDEEELRYCDSYGYWYEFQGGHSFFANIDLVFNELKIEMDQLEEDRTFRLHETSIQ